MRLVVLVLIIEKVLCSNILYVSQLPTPSHYLWNKILCLELVKKGHNVTMLTPDIEKESITNFTVITLAFDATEKDRFVVDDLVKLSNIFELNSKFLSFADEVCESNIHCNGFKALMNYPPDFKFDLIIYDTTNIFCLNGLIPRFHNPPAIGVSPLTLTTRAIYGFANPLYTSYMPFYISHFTNQMNIVERMFNVLYYWFDYIVSEHLSRQDEIAKIAFGSDIPSVYEIERNISLLLLNYDPVLDYPVPLVPNIIPVGGLHARAPKPLPQDLQSILNFHPNDVIYFAFGTNLPPEILSSAQVDVILNAFSKLPHLILWKYDENKRHNVPKNVIIRKWFPQNDILGNPKTKLFITHCGALSTQEAMVHGVPMVAMPYMFDQFYNAQKLISKEIAVMVDHKNVTFESFYSAIREVLDSPRYQTNIKLISQRYRSQPQSAMKRALFWIEHVLHFGSVDYLNSPARNMPLHKLFNLDILALLICSICLLSFLVRLITLRLISVISSKSIKEKTI